jgi:chromosome segregation ATPase
VYPFLQAKLEGLEAERELTQRSYEEVEARDSVLKFQLSELQTEFEELQSQIQDMKLANENLVYPELQKLRDSMANLDKDVRRAGEDLEKDNQVKKRMLKAQEELDDEVRPRRMRVLSALCFRF